MIPVQFNSQRLLFYSNGGECVNTYSGYFCRCPDNWEGQNCDRDVNECSRYTGLPMLLNG